ncbi:MAG: hypothetical protein AAGJ28_02055 [Pseudomonadota bacterium]
MDAGADPIEVVLRQDEAFGPDGVDIDLWMSTLTWPLTMQSGEARIVLPDRESVAAEVERVCAIARDEGVVRTRTRILSHLQPAEDTTILSSLKDRFSSDGSLLGSSPLTWTLVSQSGEWKVRQVYFERLEFGLPR